MSYSKKTEFITVRISRNQKHRLLKRAEHEGKSLSAYILDSLLDTDRYEFSKQILAELSVIRRNLSQMKNSENLEIVGSILSDLQKLYSDYITHISEM